MARKSDKKTVVALLIILGLVSIGSAVWLFTILKPVEIPLLDVQADIKLERVYRIKEVAIDNMKDFLKLDYSPESIWDNLYENQQFRELNDLEININTQDDVGNMDPFAPIIPEEGGDKKSL